MNFRIFLDTSVILKVAYNEQSSENLHALVKNCKCVLTGPVLGELWGKVEKERAHFDSYGTLLKELIDRIRRDTKDRPEKLEAKDLQELSERLTSEHRKMGSFGSKRRQAIEDIVKHLELSPHVEFSTKVIVGAFNLERELLARAGASDSPGGQDILVMASILNASKAGDVFLTFDRKLQKVASERGLQSPDPNAFANSDDSKFFRQIN